MEHYTKASSHAAESEGKKEACDIHVKSGSKIRNILAQAFRLLQNKTAEKIVLTGSGPTVTKTVTCAEIIKRKTKGLHQLNKLFYTKLQVTRKVPSISITLSKVPLDAAQPGYQAPGKSKSPVQFGDDDWDLAWEETQGDSTSKAAQKKHSEKSGKAKPKSKVTVNKGNAESKTESLEKPSEVDGSHKDQLEKGANGEDIKGNICKSRERHPDSGPLGGEKSQAGSLEIGELDSEQGHLVGGILESEKTGDGYLERSTLESNKSLGGPSVGGAEESGLGHSNGSQWTDGAQKRPSNDSCLKPKLPQTKRQKPAK
ncbi:uncharacterized protein LOC144661756 isoform X2 [Oculina patagonica]